MIQIILVLMMASIGLYVLAKGELRATRTRVLPAPVSRALGIVFLVLAALPVVFNVMTGLLIMLAGALVASAIAVKFSEPAADATPALEPSRTGPSRGKQLVGRSCVECSRKIVTADEARKCSTCNAALHRGCHRAHREAAHADEPRAPKRRAATAAAPGP